MEFNHVGLLITENCNAKCEMCCDSRGVVRGQTISEEDLSFVLQNISECEEVKTIGITGGELDLCQYFGQKFRFYCGSSPPLTIRT